MATRTVPGPASAFPPLTRWPSRSATCSSTCGAGAAIGVISTSDLILAYHHGVSPDAEAREIMSTPVHAVTVGELLSTAIQQMLVRDVQRLFVYGDASHADQIAGVLALSDAARFRSGSCRACAAGRILIRKGFERPGSGRIRRPINRQNGRNP